MLLADPATDYANVKTRAIQRAIALVYSVNPTISPLPDEATIDAGSIHVQEQVAETALLELIKVARDYYMQTTMSVSESYTPGGSSTVSSYNKVDALDTLREELEESLKVRLSLVIKEIGLPPKTYRGPTFFTTVGSKRGRRIF
jgi:hypothetical protein